jgi:phosphatidylserine/phosphatidylglycerophosphate/cardiolipin synthase-like enzyme
MVDAVKTAAHVFAGTYQFNHNALNDEFLRRLSDQSAFELVMLIDKENATNNIPHGQKTMLNNLHRAGATIVLCRGTIASGSFHAKALVVDRRTAFLGSANLTKKAERNAELCWRLRGPPVMDALAFLEEERQGGEEMQ